jgi:hypothetical protein
LQGAQFSGIRLLCWSQNPILNGSSLQSDRLCTYETCWGFPFLSLKKIFIVMWGYIVTSTKVLTTYHIDHTWIHPLHSLFLSSHSWNCFNRYHFSFYTHVYIVFAPYSPSHTLSLHPPSPPCPRQDLFYHPVLWFCKRKKGHFVCLG